ASCNSNAGDTWATVALRICPGTTWCASASRTGCPSKLTNTPPCETRRTTSPWRRWPIANVRARSTGSTSAGDTIGPGAPIFGLYNVRPQLHSRAGHEKGPRDTRLYTLHDVSPVWRPLERSYASNNTQCSGAIPRYTCSPSSKCSMGGRRATKLGSPGSPSSCDHLPGQCLPSVHGNDGTVALWYHPGRFFKLDDACGWLNVIDTSR